MSRNPRPSEVAAKLEWAATYIDRQGWCRGELADNRGRVCAVGGIAGAGKYSRRNSFGALDAVAATEAVLRYEGCGSSLPWYNDSTAKDKRYVTRLLRRTARMIRAGRVKRVGWWYEYPEYEVLNTGGNK